MERDVFTKTGESPQDALERCYPLLFGSRVRGLYRIYAQVPIDYDDLRRRDFAVMEFFDLINRLNH